MNPRVLSVPIGTMLRVPSGLDVFRNIGSYWERFTTEDELACVVASEPADEPVDVGRLRLVKCLSPAGELIGILSVETISFAVRSRST